MENLRLCIVFLKLRAIPNVGNTLAISRNTYQLMRNHYKGSLVCNLSFHEWLFETFGKKQFLKVNSKNYYCIYEWDNELNYYFKNGTTVFLDNYD